MRVEFLIIVLVIINSCQINNDVKSDNKVTGKFIKNNNETNSMEEQKEVINETKVESKETLLYEEFEAKSAVVSIENKIKEIDELLEDFEDRNKISKEEKLEAKGKLEEVKFLYNRSIILFYEKNYKVSKDIAIIAKRKAKEIIRTL